MLSMALQINLKGIYEHNEGKDSCLRSYGERYDYSVGGMLSTITKRTDTL